jgi:hypothetical protein
VLAVVAAARGRGWVPTSARLRGTDGSWTALRAALLSGTTGGAVVVTLERTNRGQLVQLLVAAYELTRRERAVTWHCHVP